MTLWSIWQLLMTGNMLAEVVDPFLTWKQLYTSVKSALTISSTAEVSHIIFTFYSILIPLLLGYRTCSIYRSYFPISL